ncbi:unnamed protein product [Paramecium sonneborni]|uniref:Protein kinase domain-containing protein n=1 Tax=Paramecium sonneborni TaxID=65129 RepID=A0A8S1QEM7_9CILI|nr:unnamed protein product [Paramecium sonneborni]
MKISQEIIGTGLTSQVKVVQIKEDYYAIKKFRDNYSVKQIRKEINILKYLNHPNIIQIIDYNLESKYIITELLNKMDLFDILAKNKKAFKINSIKYFSKQLAQVIQYLHEKGFAHRDIKLENILLDDNFNLRLCDFGLGEEMDSNLVQKSLGTLGYLAPEFYSDGLISAQELGKADIYSLGICIFVLGFAHPPYKSNTTQCPYWNLLQMGQWQQYWELIDKQNKFNQDFYSFIEGMLDQDPSKRFTIQEVLQHQFLIGEWKEEFEMEIRERLFKQ